MTTGRTVTVLGACVLLSGCYTYAYMPRDVPVPGQIVALDLNDRGRLDLEQRIGPEIARVEGQVADATDTAFTLRVSRTVGLYGGMSRWNGEAVTFRASQVRMMRERRFSTGRTVLLASSIAVAFGAFMVTRDLLGFGNESDRLPPPVIDPGDQ